MQVFIKNIPTYDYQTNEWSKTSFSEQKEFADFLYSDCFKYLGEYNLDESTHQWNTVGRNYTDTGLYTSTVPGTADYNHFWEEEEAKCRLGVIWKNKNKVWYTPRDYYFLLNYFPISNKEKFYTQTFMDIRDVQLHMMLYEKIAEAYHKHSLILKKRQMAFSICHVAKTVNYLWFENEKTLKWLASDEKYLSDVNGSWKMLNLAKTHLNTKTKWVRDFTPGEYPELQQKVKVKAGGANKWEWVGNNSTLNAITLKRDATSSVGGAGYWYWHEEGGVAPKADESLMYIDPALEVGPGLRSGSFCIGGSVGDLDQCKPLKTFMEDPEKWGFFAVPTREWDETDKEVSTGLFIPTQYGLFGAMDEFGNSDGKKGSEIIDTLDLEWQKLPPEMYLIKKSQNPKNVKQAFAWRKMNEFNVRKIEKRQQDLLILQKEGVVKYKRGYLQYSKTGGIHLVKADGEEMKYPVEKNLQDKRGVVIIREDPEKHKDGLYYAGVDSINSGESFTSESLFSIHIYKRGHTLIDKETGARKTIRGKLVAWWAGRYSELEETNEQGQLLLEMYGAKSAVERNVPNFINHCRRKGLHHLIARRRELPFAKDVDVTAQNTDEYGVWNDNVGKFRTELKRTFKEYLNAEIESVSIINDADEITGVRRTLVGYDLIDDYWLLEELKLFNGEDNSDRFISAALAISYGTAAELTYEKTVFGEIDSEKENKKPQPKKQPTVGSFLPGGRGTNKYRGNSKSSMLKY